MAFDQKMEYPKPLSFSLVVFWTGLVGGVFWGIMGYIASYFSFTEISPQVILEPWMMGNWKYGWQGMLVSIIILGIISICAAFIYAGLLKKFHGVWFGIGYGILLFVLVFIVFHPLFPGIKPIRELNRDTIITSICLYCVYGIFIGYSINYEYLNNKGQNKEAAT